MQSGRGLVKWWWIASTYAYYWMHIHLNWKIPFPQANCSLSSDCSFPFVSSCIFLRRKENWSNKLACHSRILISGMGALEFRCVFFLWKMAKVVSEQIQGLLWKDWVQLFSRTNLNKKQSILFIFHKKIKQTDLLCITVVTLENSFQSKGTFFIQLKKKGKKFVNRNGQELLCY